MRKEKQFLLDEISDQIESSDSFIVLGYSSLSANLANEFRTDVAKLGGSVEMVRKRMLVKAATEKGIDLNVENLPGHVGLVFGGTDILEATKYIFNFSKENGKTVSVLGGLFEGSVQDADTMKQLSLLPSKDEMRAQLLAVLQAPAQGVVSTMNALVTSIIYCLENKSNQN